jgi:hypothetical protein
VKDNLNEFDPDDVCPGHTYFMAKNEMELWNKFMFQIYPLLREYYKDGILKQMAKIVKLSTNAEIHLDKAMSFNELKSILTKFKEELMDNGAVHDQS